MDIVSELRRAAYHVVGIISLLALYCGLAGNGGVGGVLASAGAVVLATLATTRAAPPLRLEHGEADAAGYCELADFEQDEQR